MTIFGFMYNSCIYESSYRTVSLHLSRDGAKNELKKHMRIKFQDHQQLKKYYREIGHDRPRFGWSEDWRIHEFEILP